MILEFIIDFILLLPRMLFAILGALPFADVSLGGYVAQFIGYGCYICGTGVMSALFVSILGWCSVFAVLGIFRFVKSYLF